MRKLAKFALASILFAIPFQGAWAQGTLPSGDPPPLKGHTSLPAATKSISEDIPLYDNSKIISEGGSGSNEGFCGAGCCQQDSLGIAFFADFLYLQARGADVPYGQPFDGVGIFRLGAPKGDVGVADPDYSAGFRIGGSLYLSECSWVTATFTWFDSTTHDEIDTTPGTAIQPFLVFPNTLNAGVTSQKATATYGIDFRHVDLDYNHILCQSANYKVSYLAGFRYSHLDEDLNVNYAILGTTNVTTHINFDGFGPRVGVEGEYHIGGGLFGYSKGIVDLLAGHFGASYLQTNTFTGVQARTNIGDDRIVPQLELEIGAGWACAGDHLRISAGYYVGAWGNTLTTNSLIQGVQNSNFTTNGNNFRDTLTFDGLVSRIEVRY